MLKTSCYKLLISFVVSLSIFSIYFVTNASTIIFSDGFESDFSNWTGNDPKWDTSGGNIHGGAKRGEVKGNTEPGDDVLIKNISTSGYDGIVFEFWHRIKESFEDDDHLYVEWTGDGSDWNILNDFTAIIKSNTWTFVSYFLPIAADDQSTFAIRFRAHLSAVTSDIFYLDDVVLIGNSGTSTPSPTVEFTPTPSPSPNPSVTLTPTPSADSTPSTKPQGGEPVESTGSPQASSGSSASPMPSTNSEQATPMPSRASTPTSIPVIINTPTPTVITSPKPAKQDRGPSSNLTLTPLEDLTVTSQSSEPKLEEDMLIAKTSDNLSVSLSNFFHNSKFFWLIGIMILAVVVSLAKPKKD